MQVVQRRGRKQIRTHIDEVTDVKSFDNSGSSDTYQVDLFWRSHSLPLAGTYWTVNTALAWMDKKTDDRIKDNTGGYAVTDSSDEQVIYKGKRIRRYDLPASSFATPITANLDVITQAFSDRLMVRNSVSYTDGYRALKELRRDPDSDLRRYDIEKQGATARWDLSAEYQLFSTPSSHGSPYIRTDVVNVLDNKNIISAESGVQLFGVGRQYWLELGYRF